MKIIVDTETGEIINEIQNGDVIIKKSSSEYLKTHFKLKKEHFIQVDVLELQLTLPELDSFEKAFLLSVMPYISYENCCLQHNNRVDINTEGLIKITGICKTKIYEVIKSLKDKDIIYIGKNSKGNQYFINPFLFQKGQNFNKVIKKMFENYYIKSYGVKWKDLK